MRGFGVRRKLALFLTELLISGAFFYTINPLPVTAYLIIADIVILIVGLLYLRFQNGAFLFRFLVFGISNGLAYVLVRGLTDSVSRWSICGRNIFFKVSFGGYIGLPIVAFLVWFLSAICARIKSRRKKNQNPIDFTESKESVASYFIEARRYDLFRLEDYLSHGKAVGINGQWGTGKSELSKEFCRRHKNEIYRVSIDVLTCNEGELDTFLISELEKLLTDNCIFSSNARKMKAVLSEHSTLNDIKNFFCRDHEVKSAILDEYKKDLQKLGKTIVIVVEDLDRLIDEKSVRRLLDFTERLTEDYIKVIYEYDSAGLQKLNIDREYLQKYIPYVVNLTPVSLQEVISYRAEQDGFDSREYLFLTREPVRCRIIEQYNIITSSFSFSSYNAPIRMVNTFLKETRMYLEKYGAIDGAMKSDIRRTIIAFMFLKHFLNSIYEELDFEKTPLDELKFVSPKTGKQYSIQELIVERRINEENINEDKSNNENVYIGMTAEEVDCFFHSDEPEAADICKSNTFRYLILCLLGYDFEVMDESYRMREEFAKGISSGRWSFTEYTYEAGTRDNIWKQLHKNDKINRLVRCLHAYGFSELTDAEAFTNAFVSEVLDAPDAQIVEKWEQFRTEIYAGKNYKDTRLGFYFREKAEAGIARMLYLSLDITVNDCKNEEIWLRFLKLRYELCQDKFERGITVNYVLFCYNIDLQYKSVFMYQIEKFIDMDIVEKVSTKKLYHKFLERYLYFGQYFGFFNVCPLYTENLQESDELITCARLHLSFVKSEMGNTINTGLLKGRAKEDMETMLNFVRKNVQILDDEPPKAISATDNAHSCKITYGSENSEDSMFHCFEERCRKGVEEDELIDLLNEAYDNGQIKISEMVRLQRMNRNAKSGSTEC